MMSHLEKPSALLSRSTTDRSGNNGKIAFAKQGVHRGVRAVTSSILALALCCFTPLAASAQNADTEAEPSETTDISNMNADANGLKASEPSRNTGASAEQDDASNMNGTNGPEGAADKNGARDIGQDARDSAAPRTMRLSFDFSGIDASRGNGYMDIDGISYPLGSDGNGNFAVELPKPANDQAAARFATFCTYNNPDDAFADTSYPTGMYVWQLSYDAASGAYSSTRLSAFDNALKYAGCSVRAIGKTGIRIVTEVPKSLKSALCQGGSSGYTLLEYGTAVQWDSTLEDHNESLTLDTTKFSSYAYNRDARSDQIYKESGTSIKYTGVLVGFSDEMVKDDLSIRPYMKLVDDAGREHVLYGGVVHRSIGYIASQNHNSFGKGTVGYNYIWRMIHLKYGDTRDAELGYVNWDIRAHVPELFQNPELPWGCESVSLVIALRAMGYNVGKTEIYDSYISHSSWDYVNAFAGDAYNMTGIGEAYPPAIVNAANRYLVTHKAAERAVNLSGASFSTLLGYIDQGYPVLVWTTMYMQQPQPWGMSLYGYVPYGNEHCVVMYGHNGGIQVSDPLSGKVTRDYGAFASLYERCGRYAAVII